MATFGESGEDHTGVHYTIFFNYFIGLDFFSLKYSVEKIHAHPQTSGDVYCKFPGILALSVCDELALLRTRIKTHCWDEGKLCKSPAFAAPEMP